MQETGHNETFETPNGGKYEIVADLCGLFYITPRSGGVHPVLTEEKFTSYQSAKQRLLKWITSKEKVEYPDREKPVYVKKKTEPKEI